MAGHRTEDLFGGDFYVESEDVTRGVALGGPEFAKSSFPPGKGQADPFGTFEKEGFVSSFGAVEFLGPQKITFGADEVDVPLRPFEGRTYVCAKPCAQDMLEALLHFLEQTCDAVVTPKPKKCGLGVEANVQHKLLRFKVRFSAAQDQVGVSFVRKRGDAVDFTTTVAEATAHMSTRSGKQLTLSGEQTTAALPAPLGLPAGLMPPTGFLAPPPLGFAPPPLGLAPPLAPCALTKEDAQPLVEMLEDTSDSEGPVACLKLLDSDPALAAQVLVVSWALIEEQLRNGCVLAAAALGAKVLELAPDAQRALSLCAIALERVLLEAQLGKRQLARLLHQAAPLLPDSSALPRLQELLHDTQDARTKALLSEAELALRTR